MNKNYNIRSMAIRAIGLISNKEAFSTDIINREIGSIEDPRDKALYREMVYGTVENIYLLDYIIKKASSIKLNKIEKFVLNALRLASYEIGFLRIENYATLNEIVKIVKRKKGQRAANYVNAVLRNISENIETYKKIDDNEGKDYLSIKYSFNPDIITYLSNYYGEEKLEDILSSLSQRPKISIRVNDMKINTKDLSRILAAKGIKTYRSSLSKNALIIDNPNDLTELKEFKEGMFTIQDQASIKVSEILDPKPSSKILDLCAAPGSKSSHLLQITGDKGYLVANDISKDKLTKIEENFTRMGLKNYEIRNFDARDNIEEFKDYFDYILVDAPCSGLGVIRRKPEIKLFRTRKEIDDLSIIQKEILNKALDYLKPGGKLVYSTCTIGNQENRDVIEQVLREKSDIRLEKIDGKDYLQIEVDQSYADGFFIGKLTKIRDI